MVAPSSFPSSLPSSTTRSTGMGVSEALGIGLHASSVQRVIDSGWKYAGACPDAGVGWTRVQKYRVCSRQGPRVDFEYIAPDGKRFNSLVKAKKHSSQLSEDCAVACAACASEECAPGNDIVICDGGCGLAFHQQHSTSEVSLFAATDRSRGPPSCPGHPLGGLWAGEVWALAAGGQRGGYGSALTRVFKLRSSTAFDHPGTAWSIRSGKFPRTNGCAPAASTTPFTVFRQGTPTATQPLQAARRPVLVVLVVGPSCTSSMRMLTAPLLLGAPQLAKPASWALGRWAAGSGWRTRRTL